MPGKIIKMETQSVYKNRLAFNKAMNNLHSFHLVEWKQNNMGNEYRLTEFGEAVAKILREFL
jgi:hypothetical protein